MATIDLDPFAKRGGWKDFTWTKEPTDNGLKQLFTGGGTLLIGITKKEPPTYKLAWLDENQEWQETSELTVEATADSTSLVGKIDLLGGHRIALYQPEVLPSQVKLTGHILPFQQNRHHHNKPLHTHRVGDEPVGTFTAVANPSGGECPARRKSPHWLRWFRRLIHRLDATRLEERTAVS